MFHVHHRMYSYRLTARREEWLRCNLPTDWRTRYRFFELDAMRTRFSVSSALRTDPRTDPRTPTRTPPLPQPYPNPTPSLPRHYPSANPALAPPP